ncbi:MAG: hypothetical protein OSA81_10740 [Longimicrobiales bacterium]|nr:hypothetical protein [Longimicrobiales bacterium]
MPDSGAPANAASSAAEVLELCDLLEAMLGDGTRARLVDGFSTGADLSTKLTSLRSAMADHRFDGVSGRLATLVRKLDGRTRKDGFRVLHSWNHQTHRFTEDLVPVLLLDFFERVEVEDPDHRMTLEILLDYYFLHLLSLCAMRVWDAEDLDALLDRLTGLVTTLQGEQGSGHQFVSNAETLLIYALSQFHPEEQAYDRIIERVSTLAWSHQLEFARVSAAVLSAHLRWGFWLMYGRDVVRMRDDNVGDYPWLLYATRTLMKAYTGSVPDEAAGVAGDDLGEVADRDAILGSLLQALAADPWAFRGTVPSLLQPYETEYAEVRRLLVEHGGRLLEDLEAFRPERSGYAPLALHFNFPHNALVAIVTLALLESKPQGLPLNALFDEAFAGTSGGELSRETQEGLARTLMAFSGASSDRLGYRGAMLVAYDPLSGMRSFSMTVDTLRKSLE